MKILNKKKEWNKDLRTIKHGFTLVELLITVTIIMILSGLAITGYSEYRKVALLDLSADNISSRIEELREDAIHGDFGGNRYEEIKGEIDAEDVENDLKGSGEPLASDDSGGAKCFGFYFGNSEEGDLKPVMFSQDFIGKQKWVDTEFVYEGCGEFNIDDESTYLVTQDFGLEQSARIGGIYFGEEEKELRNFVMRFSPPKGEIDFSWDGGSIWETVSIKKEITLVLESGNSDEDQYKRKLKINLNSGKVIVTLYEN